MIADPIRSSLPLRLAPIIANCVGPKGSPIDNIRKFSNLERSRLIQILLPGIQKEHCFLGNDPVFDFTAGISEAEVDRLIKFIADGSRLRVPEETKQN